ISSSRSITSTFGPLSGKSTNGRSHPKGRIHRRPKKSSNRRSTSRNALTGRGMRSSLPLETATSVPLFAISVLPSMDNFGERRQAPPAGYVARSPSVGRAEPAPDVSVGAERPDGQYGYDRAHDHGVQHSRLQTGEAEHPGRDSEPQPKHRIRPLLPGES